MKKRKWKTTVSYTAATPQEALAKLLADEYAMTFSSYIYIRPIHAERASIEELTKPDSERKIIKWDASTEISVIGKMQG